MSPRSARSPYTVFISHSGKDLFIARMVRKEIRGAGADTWLDDNNLEGGGKLVDELLKAIRQSNEAIVLLSPDSVNSDWVKGEIGAILAQRKRLTPILINVEYNALLLVQHLTGIAINDFEKKYLADLRKRLKQFKTKSVRRAGGR